MNRLPNRRFTHGLSSGISILVVFAVGFLLNTSASVVVAADVPTATNKSSQVESIDIPGTFKELSGNTDAISAKQVAVETDATSKQAREAAPAIDASKGVVASGSSGKGGASDMKDFHATAYCLKGRTASGQYTRVGVIAADPRVLPLGTVVHIRAGRYTGNYTVLDTGGRIKGRIVDIYLPTYKEALRFGRQRVKLTVIGRARSNNVTPSNDPAQKIAAMAAP